MKYMTFLFIFLSSCNSSSLPIPKFHYGDKVSFQDKFYGECHGKITQLFCGSEDCSYGVQSSCSGTEKTNISSAVEENRLTRTDVSPGIHTSGKVKDIDVIKCRKNLNIPKDKMVTFEIDNNVGQLILDQRDVYFCKKLYKKTVSKKCDMCLKEYRKCMTKSVTTDVEDLGLTDIRENQKLCNDNIDECASENECL